MSKPINVVNKVR